MRFERSTLSVAGHSGGSDSNIWNVPTDGGRKPTGTGHRRKTNRGPTNSEKGPPVKPRAGFGCASDCVYTAKDSFARRLVYRWTTLPTRDFYGTVVAMDPASFPQLNTPGRWRLRGTYKSIGNLSSSHCWDTAPIPDNEEQIKGLPYEAWQGEVNTNTVWIEVLRARSSATAKKSP